MKIGLLVSGALGCRILEFIHNKYELVFVMTDSASESIISFCRNNGIVFYKGNPRHANGLEFYNAKEIDVLLSANYLFLITKSLISLPRKLAFNVHGSLLPKYRGRTPHVWAIINNEKITGLTAHVIDEGCDSGDILEQVQVPLSIEDTGNDILKKFNALYPTVIELVLTKLEAGKLQFLPQAHLTATYFGKRGPEDGHIIWDWQKERIMNWVRAQAYPYPGAFTFYEGEKLVIDKIAFVDDGFDSNMPNGLILSDSPLKIKTPNGVIVLSEIRPFGKKIEINKIVR